MTKRTPVIAGNWKMNTDIKSSRELALQILELTDEVTGVTKIVCPPFVTIAEVSELLHGSSIQVGAQNVNSNPDGAFTGEISVSMLSGLVNTVIVGHSERRTLNGESSALVAAKAKAASNAGITPIICTGESINIRDSGNAVSFVSHQLSESLESFTDWESLIVAYEPVWAIGSGQAATSEQAQEMALICRQVIRELSGNMADSVPVLYGGSVNSVNISEFIGQPDIDGALVGGSSLKAKEYSKLVHIAATY